MRHDFDVKVQLHQFGSNPQQPEDSHRPIKKNCLHQALAVCFAGDCPKRRTRVGHRVPRFLAGRTAPSNFLGSIQDRVESMLVCGFGERRSHSSIAGSQTLACHVFDAIPAEYRSMGCYPVSQHSWTPPAARVDIFLLGASDNWAKFSHNCRTL